jgi:hypothetical protein
MYRRAAVIYRVALDGTIWVKLGSATTDFGFAELLALFKRRCNGRIYDPFSRQWVVPADHAVDFKYFVAEVRSMVEVRERTDQENFEYESYYAPALYRTLHLLPSASHEMIEMARGMVAAEIRDESERKRRQSDWTEREVAKVELAADILLGKIGALPAVKEFNMASDYGWEKPYNDEEQADVTHP